MRTENNKEKVKKVPHCDWCGCELPYDEEADCYIPHDHIDDSPDSSLTAELNYARRADY